MPERLPSDHFSIETVRGRVERHGGGVRLATPAATFPADETVVRTILEDRTRFALLGSTDDGDRWVTGIFDSARAAAEPGQGTDRLEPWLDDRDRGVGSSVEIDVIDAGYLYGLRAPGTRTVYAVPERPPSNLAAIARDLEDS